MKTWVEALEMTLAALAIVLALVVGASYAQDYMHPIKPISQDIIVP